ncbi:MAG: glycosyltransferase family 2 protein [Paracoccaceae bacterium]
MPDTAPPKAGRTLRRSLTAQDAAGLRVLDAAVWEDGGTRRFRAFFASGTASAAVGEAPGTTLTERREVSGGLLVAGTDRRELGEPVIVTGPDGPARIAPAAPDRGLFADRNVILAFRGVETPETVADWARYHAGAHGMQAALIVNRAGTGQADFAAEVAEATADLGLTIVVLDAPVPLGKPDTGPESHPFLAPDAPGKDRMERPAPDPWLAPLGEGLIYEIAKWRFLARARAVLTLDVSDLLAARPPGTPTAFDLCTTAGDGVILLVGRRTYPWRVRKGRPEGFGDHICRQFDNRRGIARWGVAPARSDPERTWRATRVAYARPDPGTAVPFWRAMALRVPGRKPSELAPKTSLVEDPVLIDLAIHAFRHQPVYAPLSDLDDYLPPEKAAEGTGTVIVTAMKNEGPFILEWIAHHRAIGVSGFLVYTNDCTDGTDTLLDALAAQGIVTRRDNPFRALDLKPQHAALQAAEAEPLVLGAAWVVAMDVDEFIDVKLGQGRLSDLYAAMEGAMEGANMVALTWRLFGNADVSAYEDRFVTEQFPLCAPELVRKPHQAWGFKTLFRNIEIYKKLGVHRPKGLRPDLWDQVKWLNGSGQPMPRELFRNGWRSSAETYGYDWVSLNHYAVRSAESFLVKRDRGRVNHVDRDQGLNYWFRMNHNAVEETSIRRMLPAARTEFDRLMALPGVRAAHQAAVTAHRAKIAGLRARPEQAAFFAELTGERMRALSRMLHVFGASVFNAGPEVIPEDLHRRDLPPDFYFTVDHDGDAEH